MTDKDFVLLGIDGGATKVSGWTIEYDADGQHFSLGEQNSSCLYRDLDRYIPDFKPVDIPVQLDQKDKRKIHITQAEQRQGTIMVEGAVQVISSLAVKSGAKQVLIGMGMPGLKTEDQRGIAVLANGPRIPDFCNQLEKMLQVEGLNLLVPIGRLGSDADYCGIGEEYSENGLFRDILTGYYLGGGTGVADALKIDGRLIPFDQINDWMAKTWELKSPEGPSMERYISVGGLQALYADMNGTEVKTLNEQGIYPMQIAERAEEGEKTAQDLIKRAVQNLAMLLFDRIINLYSGATYDIGFVNPNRASLSEKHPFLGKLFDRIIIGQRLGELMESEAGSSQLKNPLLKVLSDKIQASDVLASKAKSHYRHLSNIIVCSALRDAPVLGAGIDAFHAWQKRLP